MEVRAVSKSIRQSPRKIRLVVDAIRNLSIEEAFRVLDATDKRASTPIAKTLKSAVANAINNANLDLKDLVIGTILVNEGQSLKRFRPSTRGRIHPYKKRGTNLTIVVKSVTAPVVASNVVAKPEAKQLPTTTEKQEAVVAVEEKKTKAKKVSSKEEKGGNK